MAYEAYPLSWPPGWPRTPAEKRRHALFGKVRFVAGSQPGTGWHSKGELSIVDGWSRVLLELTRLGVDREGVVVSTNVRVRLDGMPRSDQRMPDDPGVSVYWTGKSGARCMAVDIYDRVADNLGAVAASLEALRLIERHGGAQILERAFTGFTALPPPIVVRSWRQVFGYAEGEADPSDVYMRYLNMRSKRHPDKGGSHDGFVELQRAWEQARAELGIKMVGER